MTEKKPKPSKGPNIFARSRGLLGKLAKQPDPEDPSIRLGASQHETEVDERVKTIALAVEPAFASKEHVKQRELAERMLSDLELDKQGMDKDVVRAHYGGNGPDFEGIFARASVRFTSHDEDYLQLIEGMTGALCGNSVGYDELFYLMDMSPDVEHILDRSAPNAAHTATGPRRHTQRLQQIDRFQKPKVLESEVGGSKVLYLPTQIPGVVMGFGGLGLTHPGNHEANPMRFDIYMLPQELLGQDLSAELAQINEPPTEQ